LEKPSRVVLAVRSYPTLLTLFLFRRYFTPSVSGLSPAQPQSPISSCTYCAGIDFLYQMNSTLVCNTMHYPRKTPTTFLLSVTEHTSVIQVIAMIVTICAAQARVFQPRKRSCIIVMSDPVVPQEGVSLVQASMQCVKVEVL